MKSLAAASFLFPVLALARPVGNGIPFTHETPAPAAAVEPARKALADQLDGTVPPITAARLDLGREGLLAWAESGRLCGNEVGCPTAILVRQGASWRAVWTGTSFGRGAVLASRHAGLDDVSLGSPHGMRLLTYDGTSYVETP